MKSEIVKEEQAEKIMEEIGVYKEGIQIMRDKTKFRLLKINSVRTAVANILKQEMLSAGGDVAVSPGTVNCKIENTDVLIMGTLKQYKILAEKIKAQGKAGISGCEEVAEEIEEKLIN